MKRPTAYLIGSLAWTITTLGLITAASAALWGTFGVITPGLVLAWTWIGYSITGRLLR